LGLQNKDLDSYFRIREDIVVIELLGENVRNRKIISASVKIILLNFFFRTYLKMIPLEKRSFVAMSLR
jgi:hypothetical protein